jgi:hypothetical protein
VTYTLSFTRPAEGSGQPVLERVVCCAFCLYAYQRDGSVAILKLMPHGDESACEAPHHEGERGEPAPTAEAPLPRTAVNELLRWPREEWRKAMRKSDSQIISTLLLDLIDELVLRGQFDRRISNAVYTAMEVVH